MSYDTSPSYPYPPPHHPPVSSPSYPTHPWQPPPRPEPAPPRPPRHQPLGHHSDLRILRQHAPVRGPEVYAHVPPSAELPDLLVLEHIAGVDGRAVCSRFRHAYKSTWIR